MINIRKNILIVMLLLIMVACTPGSKEENAAVDNREELNEKNRKLFIGEWRNLSLKVTMKDPDSVMVVPVGDWENILQIKPIRTTFKEDGTYISEYRTLEDSVFMTTSGVWNVDGDTLMMDYQGTNNYYHYKLDGDKAAFTGYIDWDEEGEADDLYTGIQQRHE